MILQSSKFNFSLFFSSKTECFLRIVRGTFLCMRLNHIRGPTPRLMGMDDRQEDEKGDKNPYFFPI